MGLGTAGSYNKPHADQCPELGFKNQVRLGNCLWPCRCDPDVVGWRVSGRNTKFVPSRLLHGRGKKKDVPDANSQAALVLVPCFRRIRNLHLH